MLLTNFRKLNFNRYMHSYQKHEKWSIFVLQSFLGLSIKNSEQIDEWMEIRRYISQLNQDINDKDIKIK